MKFKTEVAYNIKRGHKILTGQIERAIIEASSVDDASAQIRSDLKRRAYPCEITKLKVNPWTEIASEPV